MKIILNKEEFFVNQEEFPVTPHPEYSTLILRPTLGIFEREISLIKELSKCTGEEIEFVNIGISHGGYVPLKIVDDFKSIKIVASGDQLYNFTFNKKIYDVRNVIKVVKTLKDKGNRKRIIRFDGEQVDNINSMSIDNSNVLSILTLCPLTIKGFVKYTLKDSKLHLLVSTKIDSKFKHIFRYFLNDDYNIVNYDNLINLCIMVKDAGPMFKEILEQNLPFIDRWTILDTGSTDNTIETIKSVYAAKMGKLYREPFINFRDSRNRCLELAGTFCKYTIMLDDTYVLTGKVREFLNFIRSDQYADSYNIFVHSGDMQYGSNRIIKSVLGLRYVHKIHEIINPVSNIVVQLPDDQLYIRDMQNEYMIQRSRLRKEGDLKLLHIEIEQDPDNPRHLYYMAQTCVELEMWKEACEYFQKRIDHPIAGYNEEITDSYFQQAYIGKKHLNLDWAKCEKLYLKCHNFDKNLVDPLFCIGYYYYLKGENNVAYEYFKQGFQLGFPVTTSNLRPNIYKIYIPKFLTSLCYQYNDYQLGELAARRYIENNDPNETIISYFKIFQLLNKSVSRDHKEQSDKPILCFVANGGFKSWSGSSIDHKGVGGSETFIIELSRNIAMLANLKVYVFCNCPKEEEFEGVSFRNITDYVPFINMNRVEYSIISRYSEYIPVTLNNNVNNVYLVIHDLLPSGNVIPTHENLRTIFCLTEWHKEHFLDVYPMFKDKVHIFPNGINIKDHQPADKKANSFIYSSFPNRGLINLLKMFPKIREKIPNASLDVFCDTTGDFVQRVSKSEMIEVDRLLKEQQEYVTNHGWVSKKGLQRYWSTASIWLYPCTFMETFCITALEAAASKTLAVTNDLAALQNTVGDRGIVTSGDPRTNEWQQKAIDKIVDVLGDENKMVELVDKNRQWAEEYDWKKLVWRFVNELKLVNELITFPKYYGPIKENINVQCQKCIHCTKVLEVGPGLKPFPLATHYVDHRNRDNVKNLTVLDITRDKLPFLDNEFDLVYCRHVLEDIHNPDFVLKELFRVAKNGYIETPSPIAETTRRIDITNVNYRGYIHHRYLIWVNKDGINFLPKYPIIEYLDDIRDCSDRLTDPYFWNTYFTWGECDDLNYRFLQDFDLNVDYSKIINKSLDECQESILDYKDSVTINYAGMLNWSSDIPIGSKVIFENVLDRFKNKKCTILEIGAYTGTSIINMLMYLHDSTATVIDKWEDYDEGELLQTIKERKIEAIFYSNLKVANVGDRVRAIKGDSKDVLNDVLKNDSYDFIYVDGSHKYLDCYNDMVASWSILNKGGVLAIDDYLWTSPDNQDTMDTPFYAIERFTKEYKTEFTLLDKGYRVFLLKNFDFL